MSGNAAKGLEKTFESQRSTTKSAASLPSVHEYSMDQLANDMVNFVIDSDSKQ